MPRRPRSAQRAFTLAVVGAAALLALAVLASLGLPGDFESPSVTRLEDRAPLLLLAGLALIGVALWGWRRESRAREALERAEAHAHEQREQALREERERAEHARRTAQEAAQRAEHAERRGDEAEGRADEAEERARQAQEHARQSGDRAEQAEERARQADTSRRELMRQRDVDRAWARELRSRLRALNGRHGPLGDVDDVRELVLRVVLELLEAERGLLLTREDEDGDGKLELVCTQGFEHDPSDSQTVQRLADRVVERDETVREDTPRDGGSPADDEIRCLVAIPIYIADGFAGIAVAANREGGFEDYDDDVLLALGDHAGALLDQSRLQGQLRSAYLSTIAALADAIEAKDPSLRGHSDDVAAHVAAVARKLDLDAQARETLVFASLLHDVGKIGISERILLKDGPLTPEERSVIELHPRIGFRIVGRVPALRDIGPAVLHHHERFDGTGYPMRLRGDQIPLEARVVGVADAFSAMTTDRPYRDPMSVEDACDELVRGAGTQFDPTVVEAFVEEVRATPKRRRAAAVRLQDADDDPELRAVRGDATVLGGEPVALVDGLTLLYAHRHLQDAAAAQARRAGLQGTTFGCVVLRAEDLDEVNQQRGYAAGDALLRSLAERVEAVAQRHRGTAGRLSGRCLAVVLPAGGTPAELASTELRADLRSEDGTVALGTATSQGDESGHAVLHRAAEAADTPPDGSPPT